jgi:DNA-directed RNA polymerase subunit omega
MARITVEDSLREAKNRFALVLLAAQRTRQLLKGSQPLIKAENREIVTALREVAAAKVKYAHPEYLIAVVEEERPALEDYSEFVGEEEDIE